MNVVRLHICAWSGHIACFIIQGQELLHDKNRVQPLNLFWLRILAVTVSCSWSATPRVSLTTPQRSVSVTPCKGSLLTGLRSPTINFGFGWSQTIFFPPSSPSRSSFNLFRCLLSHRWWWSALADLAMLSYQLRQLYNRMPVRTVFENDGCGAYDRERDPDRDGWDSYLLTAFLTTTIQ